MKLTANMVTIGRILLLPLPCLLILYGDIVAWWFGFAFFSLLGMTDFVDGMMARKEGPTKLGGLIDPVADKIFIAAVMIPLVAVRFFPVWSLCIIIGRELLITALRSSVSYRGEEITTSNLAKLKTIYQMGGFGTIFMTYAFPRPLLFASSFLLFAVLGMIGLWYLWIKRKPVPFWIFPVSLAFLLVFCLGLTVSIPTAIMVQLVIIVVLTCLSALDYLIGSYRILAKEGVFRYDIVRGFWVVAHGVLVLFTLPYYPQAALWVLIAISCELALGGIDNIVAAEKSYAGSKAFFATSGMAVVYFLAVILKTEVLPLWPIAACYALVSLIVLATVFKKWRFLFKNVI